MSQREGHATGGAAPPRADGPPPGAPRPASGQPRAWDDILASLPPDRQQPLLDLARRQGFLLADQIPPAPAKADTARPVLQHAIAGKLPPVPLPEPLNLHDAELDDAQRDAVARAVTAPDLFLILGPAGTGKTRVAIEIIRQVATAGGRCLFLGLDAAGIDGVLPRFSETLALAISRRLGPGEAIDRLPPAVAALTPAGREAAVRETLVRQAGGGRAAAEERLRRLEELAPVWDELDALRTRQAARAVERDALAAKRQSVTTDVRGDVDTASDPVPFFVQRLRGATAAHTKRLASLDANAAELQKTRTEAEERERLAEAECRELQPKADARRRRRWYTLTYWRAPSDSVARLAAAEQRLAAENEALAEVAIRDKKCAADRQLAEEEQAALVARLLDAETARRLAELDTCATELGTAAAADAAREAALAARLRAAGVNWTERAAGSDALAAARLDLDFARDWAARVETGADEIVREACAAVSVVAGPIGCVAADPWFANVGPFDLLIVDDAQRLSEADFLPAARLARRWVLVGGAGEGPSRRGPRANGADLLGRLAAALRHQIWEMEGGRPVCRLHPVRGGERRRLECEPVADAPDIELRLFTPPGAEPILAEVAFRDGTTPVSAREYLFRELGEVTCQPRTRTGVWESTPDGPVLRFGPAEPGAAFAVVGAGIREELTGFDTSAVHFAADWSVERAKEWVATHLSRPAGSRVVTLSRPYRACPGLARWLNRAFATGFAVNSAGDDGPHVEFLAVPDSEPRRRHVPPHSRPNRVGGAGYEIDLADPRQRAALPPDLTELPANGFVNLAEAQALVRHLEHAPGSSVALTSPFRSQVALLQQLLTRSSRLAHVRVFDPTDAGRYECEVLAVSLTRSHVTRAVTFGETPAVLAGLLSRARKKVLFAGDPGTLARRLQWEGPVDHLDAAEAARERAWVAALADCPRVSPARHRHAPTEGVRA